MKKDRPRSRPLWRKLRMSRRISQGVFLLLFLFLIFATAALTGAGVDTDTAGHVPYPVEAFLDIDPLVGLLVALSTGAVSGSLIFGVAVLGLAFILGRAFCGWVCPMGTLNHLTAEIKPGLKGKKRIDANRVRPYRKIKYLVLAGSLAAALFGSAVGGLFDPISLATRGISMAVIPAVSWLLGNATELMTESGVGALQGASDLGYDALGGVLLYQRGFISGAGVTIMILFAAALVANRWVPRFWCRALCPLGALLGTAGRFGVLTLKKDEARCNNCGKCTLTCTGAAGPSPDERWQRAECELCMNCVAECAQDALSFVRAGVKTDEQPLPDLKRRSVLAGATAGALVVPVLRSGAVSSVDGRPDPACIRPPGSVDEQEFLARCIRCGQCMKICPNNALHPALDEAGPEGLWTPVMVPRVGYCEPTCTLCSQVCPTAAIKRVSEDEKTGKDGAEMVRVGTAFFDRGRCLPWAMGTPCTVCEEFCPVSPKAIHLKEEEVEIFGEKRRLKVPYLDPSKCNGCGACENVCPVNDKAAVRVSCAGESRSRKNRLLLSYTAPKSRGE